MRISAFMIPAEKVITCSEWDTIHNVMETVLEKKISAVVVLGDDKKPRGIVTKTDFVAAYHQGINMNQKVGLVMVKDLDTISEMESRDRAAALFERQGHHHAVVVNASGDFVGLISAWDIAAECARDGRAWPWMRTDDGKIQAAH